MRKSCIVMSAALLLFSCATKNKEELNNSKFSNNDWIKIDSNYSKIRNSDPDTLFMGVVPENGFIPDEITALKMAEIILLPIYGNSIYDCKPYIIELKNGVWVIEGTLPKGSFGGTPYVEIQKKDGKVLKVYHGK